MNGHNLNSGRKQGLLPDVVITVGEKEHPCHKFILALGCDYFRAMFANDFRESNCSAVTIQELHGNTFDLILDYIYGGAINITGKNVLGLLKNAHFLMLNDLLDVCSNYLLKNIDLYIVFELNVFLIASHMQEQTIYKKLGDFLNANIDDVIDLKHDEILKLNFELFDKFFRKFIPRIIDLDYFYELVVEWMNFKEERKGYHCDIIDVILSRKVDIISLKKHISSNENFKRCQECLVKLKLSSSSKIDIESKPAKESIICLIGGDIDDKGLFLMFNPNTNSFTHCSDLGKGICGHECVAIGKRIFLIGGRQSNCDIKQYHCESRRWNVIYRFEHVRERW